MFCKKTKNLQGLNKQTSKSNNTDMLLKSKAIFYEMADLPQCFLNGKECNRVLVGDIHLK